MTDVDRRRGGTIVGTLGALEAWQAELILDFRMWCDGPEGQIKVLNRIAQALEQREAKEEMLVLERLIDTIGACSYRQLVRRHVDCACIGADEAVFLHLIEVASEGDLHEAARIASLMVTAAHAERVALMAAQVGVTAKTVSRRLPAKSRRPDWSAERLH